MILLLGSCSDEIDKNLDSSFFGYEYYPLEEGNFWIYRVDSLIIDDLGATQIKTHSYIKEEISDPYLNVEGDTMYKLVRSISDDPDGPFRISDVWTTQMTVTAAFRTEENLRFNKMSFPLELDKSWTGNLFDNLVEVSIAGEMIWVYKDWGEYQLIAKGIEHTVNDTSYEDVAVILQADHDFAIERRYSIEYYAAGVGLIEREMIIFDTQCACPGQSWEEKADAGFTLKQILLESN